MKLTRIEKFKIKHIGLMTEEKVDSIINKFNELPVEDKKYVYDAVNSNYEKQIKKFQEAKFKVEDGVKGKKKGRSIDDETCVETTDFIAASFILGALSLPLGGLAYLISGSEKLAWRIVLDMVVPALIPLGMAFVDILDDDEYHFVKHHPYALHLKKKSEKAKDLKTSLDEKVKNVSTTTVEEPNK